MYEILNDDSFSILKAFPSHCIDLIVTDPPYEISEINGGGTVNNLKKLNKSLQDLKTTQDLTKGYDIEVLGEELLRIMKEPNIYFWCNKKQIPAYFDFWVNKQKCKFEIICWHKTNAMPTYSNKYLTDTEYLLYFHRGKGKCFPQNYEDAKTFYIAPINHSDKKKYGFPTIKPLDISRKIIRNSSKEGQIILDPFLGSGTTIIAAEVENRNSIGIEINQDYFNLAKDRIEKELEEIRK